MTDEMWLGVGDIYNSEISSTPYLKSHVSQVRSGHSVMTYSVRLLNDRSSAFCTKLVFRMPNAWILGWMVQL